MMCATICFDVALNELLLALSNHLMDGLAISDIEWFSELLVILLFFNVPFESGRSLSQY